MHKEWTVADKYEVKKVQKEREHAERDVQLLEGFINRVR